MIMRFRQQAFLFIALLLTSGSLLLSSLAHAGAGVPLKPYRATYGIVRDGLAAEVTRELHHSGENQWTLKDSARILFARFSESVIVKYNGVDVVPLEYTYQQSPGDRKDQVIRYDWGKKRASFSLDSGTRHADLKVPSYDKLSYQIQLRLDLLAGQLQTPKTYHLVDRGRHKQYRVEKIGEQTISAGKRQIHTVKLRQTTAGKDRETFIWVAPDLDFLIVRMERNEDDEQIQMQLKSVNLDIAA
ncbi:DUF3108 domain-containing protein, partial [Litorivivens sp.]